MPLSQPKDYGYTIKDIYALPDGERAELIDGKIYMMSPPSRTHQRIAGELHTEINMYIKRNQGNCEVNISPFAVFLSADSKTYVEPDVFVVCDKKKLDDQGCHGAPDWAIEIVSPSSRRMDYLMKLVKYMQAGMKEYWIVDPLHGRVTVHDFQHEEMKEFTFNDVVPVGIYEDFSIDFKEITI